MKAFEEWFGLEWQNLQGGRREPVGEELAEVVWRAALEWVQLWYCERDGTDVHKKIRQELED